MSRSAYSKRQRCFWERFCKHLKPAGVELPCDHGPQIVLQEYKNVDLVMVWGEWILLVENKVAAASITRGQLVRYYQDTLAAMEQGIFLKSEDMEPEDIRNKRICIVYLTPTRKMGTAEFKSTKLKTCK